jgi:hypothetical protein
MNPLNASTQKCYNDLLGAGLVVDGELGDKSIAAEKALLGKLVDVFAAKKYVWNNNNLIGIRMSDVFTDEFTDYGIITIGSDIYAFPISTKPGSYFLTHPENKNGCACLKEGQWKNMWMFHDDVSGWTGDPYCRQISPVTVLRQAGKSVGDTIDRSKEDTDSLGSLNGINFHTWKNFNGARVYNLSAGCNVMQEGTEIEILPMLKQYFAGMITYTLLNKNDFTNAT